MLINIHYAGFIYFGRKKLDHSGSNLLLQYFLYLKLYSYEGTFQITIIFQDAPDTTVDLILSFAPIPWSPLFLNDLLYAVKHRRTIGNPRHFLNALKAL